MTRRVFFVLIGWAVAVLVVAIVASLFACAGRGCPQAQNPTSQPTTEKSCPRGR